MPSWRSGRHSRVLRHRRASADCFGANPVASALGNRARRDPGTAVRTYHEGFQPTLKTGTFYLAGNRNFLFGSDSAGCHNPGRPGCPRSGSGSHRVTRDTAQN